MVELVLKWFITLLVTLSKVMFGCRQAVLVAGDGSVIFRHSILVCPFSWHLANPHFSFIIALTVTVDGEPQSYNTLASTCCVMPRFFGRVFCRGFEGVIRFDLAAK